MTRNPRPFSPISDRTHDTVRKGQWSQRGKREGAHATVGHGVTRVGMASGSPCPIDIFSLFGQCECFWRLAGGIGSPEAIGTSTGDSPQESGYHDASAPLQSVSARPRPVSFTSETGREPKICRCDIARVMVVRLCWSQAPNRNLDWHTHGGKGGRHASRGRPQATQSTQSVQFIRWDGPILLVCGWPSLPSFRYAAARTRQDAGTETQARTRRD